MKKFFSVCVCLLLFLALFISANNFFNKKTSYQKNADFYNTQEDFEVLFLGSSHMIMGISPMELWNDYGITSYNMSNYGQYLPVDYWVLENALDYTTPKLVVIDVFFINKDVKYSSQQVAKMHEMFDIMPLTKNKLHAIQDLLPKERHMEFLFPFSFYHSRWNEIDSTFWSNPVPSTEKGGNLDNSNGLTYATVSECKEPDWIAHSQKSQTQTIGKDYLEKIIKLCQENDIEVSLVALPFAPTEEQQLYLNGVQDIADEYNIKYFNMNQTDGYINYSTDMYDEGHLNSSGARKATAVLGKYLVENYNLPNLKESNVASKWNQDYIMYTKDKFLWLKKQTELNSYLMLLSQDKYKIIITINDSSLLKNATYAHLLENLSVDPDSIQENTKYIIIDCPNNTAKVINNLKPDENETNISLGNLSYVVRQNAQDYDALPPYSEIYLDGTKIYSSSSSHSESALHITVISTVTKEVIDDVDYQSDDQLFIRN